MNQIIIWFAVLVSAGTANSFAAPDAPSPNRYHAAIVPRNLFHLREPEIDKPPVSPRPERRVELAGLTTILGAKLAVLRVTGSGPATTPGLSLMLGEGAAAAGVRVLEMDFSNGTVKVDVDGEIRLLDIRKDSPGDVHTPVAPPAAVQRTSAVPSPKVQVSSEEAAIVFESWRIRDQAKVAAGELPPYPPSELSEMLDQESHPQIR